MLLYIALAVAVLVIIVLLLAAAKPAHFSMQRSTTISAPPDKVAALLTDFRRWIEWSPWEAADPALKRTYSGAASGKGAVYEWAGNKKAGAGRMEIIEAATPATTLIKLDFITPFEAHNMAEFTLKPQGALTNINWEMRGPMPFISKLMSVFVNFDKLVGKDFEKGLANLKHVAEQ
jgi:hypothetical protein